MPWDKKDGELGVGIEIFKSPKQREEITSLVIGVFGLTFTGKTHFGLTGPEPVFVIDTELGVEQVVTRNGSPFISKEKGGTAKKDKDIRIAKALVADDKNDVDLIASLRNIEQSIDAVTRYAIDHPEECGTIVVDTASELWAWYGLWLETEGATKFTKSGDIMRTEWSKANKPYTRLIYRLRLCGWNVILLGKAKELYTKGGEATGFYVARMQKDTEHWVDVMLEARHLGTHREFVTVKNRLKDGIQTYRDPDFNMIFKDTTGHNFMRPPPKPKEANTQVEVVT